ncbi:MAG: PKD domain-containing protein, partial [Bacteroidota bacterium]|nr:PKD domain-containing protein [Bacteroidota bacterium]
VFHVYQQSGDYLVKLTAFNDSTSCSFSDSIWITARQPIASFSFSDNVCINSEVVFDASASVDVYSHCTNGYQWNFGDSSPLINTSADSVTHIFSEGGKYRVELTVYDENGCKHTVSDSIKVFEIHAGYSISPTQVCVPGNVSFYDFSYGDTTIVSWNFNFGDGNSSQFFPPSHWYTISANIELETSLQVTDALGCTDEVSYPVTLFYPQASIVASDSAFCTNTWINFHVEPGFPNVHWYFGDTTTSTQISPYHSYSDPGFYDVSVSVTDAAGCTDSITMTNFVEVFPRPEALFISEPPFDTLCVPVQVFFSDVSTVDTLVWRNWNISGGSGIADDSIIAWVFNYPGNYHVTLQVANSYGCYDSYTDSFLIIGPVMNFSINTDTLCYGGEIEFNIIDTFNVDGWILDFGDGYVDSSQNMVISHSYDPGFIPATGQVTATLFYWSDACEHTDSLIIPFYSEVIADYTIDNWSDSVICFGDEISLINNSQNSISWQWTLGNNYSQPGFNVNNYQYPFIGDFIISLVATSIDGCKDSIAKPVVVTGVYAELGVSADLICHEGLAFFTDNSSADAGIAIWHIDYDDGTSSNTYEASHYFSNPPSGSSGYYVELTVTGNLGCIDTDTGFIPFSNPVADFTASTTDPCLNDIVNFLANSSFINYYWEFGTGTSSSDISPDYEYSQTGVYTVSLIAENSLGCKDTVVYIDYITVHEFPVAGFSYLPVANPHCAPAEITFTDNSSCPDPYNISWDYPSGQSTDNPLEVSWENPGQYVMVLTVTSNFGCETSTSTTLIVEAPVADLIIDPTEFCLGDVVSFTIENPLDLVSWTLEFGDGDIHTNNSSYNVTHTYSTPAPNGQFEIVLNMFSPNCEASVSQNINLILPVASFEVPLKACVGDELEFNNLSEIANEYYWVFGDSSSSTDENPVHTYAQAGTYNVILSATYNPLGCSDAASKIITIYDPSLNLILPSDSFCLDQPVNFIVSSLFDIAGWE